MTAATIVSSEVEVAMSAAILRRKAWPWLPTYVAADLEGSRWTFAQARPTQRS
ncbi:MAG: hypothetical protein ACRDNF_22225 [Streptosporangiaceae bacterium]